LRETARWSWALFIFERPSMPSFCACLYSSSLVGPWPLRLAVLRLVLLRDDVLLRLEVLRPDELRPDVLRPDVLRPDVLRADVLRPDELRPELDVLRPDVLRADVLRPLLFDDDELRFAPVPLLPLRLDDERDDEEEDDDDERDEPFVSPAFERDLLTVRAAISFARFVDSPFFCSLSFTCSYCRSRFLLHAFCGMRTSFCEDVARWGNARL
jgi:hypothetical protein